MGGRFYLKEEEGEGRGRVWEFMTESLGVIVSDIFLLITNYEREIIICGVEGGSRDVENGEGYRVSK